MVAALIVAASYLHFGMPITNGREVQAEVLRVGTRPVARAAGGDLPTLTVRLSDGTIVEASVLGDCPVWVGQVAKLAVFQPVSTASKVYVVSR